MKRKIIVMATLVVLLATSPTRAEGLRAKILDPEGHSNLRDKAGKVIGKVKAGETVTASSPEDGSDWWRVRLASGKEGYVHKSRLLLPQSRATKAPTAVERIPRETDVSVAGIRLSDPDSTERVLGKNVGFVEENNGFPVLRILNADRTEVVELTQHYGGVVNEVREFEVKPVSGKVKGIVLPNVEHFATGKGIHLGMSEQEVTSILGKPVKIERRGKNRVLEYLPKDAQARYQASPDFEDTFELYYGHYTFRDGKLREFAFGMVYP